MKAGEKGKSALQGKKLAKNREEWRGEKKKIWRGKGSCKSDQLANTEKREKLHLVR